LQQLNPYLSDQALELLDTKADGIKSILQNNRTIDIERMDTVDKANLEVKNHMLLVNSGMSEVSSFIVQVITYDIFYEYFFIQSENQQFFTKILFYPHAPKPF